MQRKRGYIYILCSAERPGVLKIGRTSVSPRVRCEEHNRNWYLSLNSWEVLFWRWVEDCCAAEGEIHIRLRRHNLGAKGYREAFRVDINYARDVAVEVCDKYPASSDKPHRRPPKHQRELDRLAFEHIQGGGALAGKIVEFKKLMRDVDFYKWLSEIKPFL